MATPGSNGWLTQYDLDNKWTQVVDSDNVLGWIDNYNADRLHLDYQMVESPKRYMTDTFVKEAARMANKQGLLSGSTMSEVQQILLYTIMISERSDEEEMRVRDFEEKLWMTNPDLWKAYSDRKEQMEAATFEGDDFEEVVPQSIEEFFETLNLFSEGLSEADKEEAKEVGWLDLILDEDEIAQMGE